MTALDCFDICLNDQCSVDGSYVCRQCSKKICSDCYDSMKRRDMLSCPFCRATGATHFVRIGKPSAPKAFACADFSYCMNKTNPPIDGSFVCRQCSNQICGQCSIFLAQRETKKCPFCTAPFPACLVRIGQMMPRPNVASIEADPDDDRIFQLIMYWGEDEDVVY